MSNVLIGIIGVILFIGLALAGALFLGPRFQQSTVDSKAASLVQAVTQVSHAANMSTTNTGQIPQALSPGYTGASTTALVTSGYLKSAPPNAYQPGYTYDMLNGSGNVGGNAAFIVTGLQMDAGGTAVCNSINRQTGASTATTPPSQATAPTAVTGCFNPTAWPAVSNTLYVVYTRM